MTRKLVWIGGLYIVLSCHQSKRHSCKEPEWYDVTCYVNHIRPMLCRRPLQTYMLLRIKYRLYPQHDWTSRPWQARHSQHVLINTPFSNIGLSLPACYFRDVVITCTLLSTRHFKFLTRHLNTPLPTRIDNASWGKAL